VPSSLTSALSSSFPGSVRGGELLALTWRHRAAVGQLESVAATGVQLGLVSAAATSCADDRERQGMTACPPLHGMLATVIMRSRCRTF